MASRPTHLRGCRLQADLGLTVVLPVVQCRRLAQLMQALHSAHSCVGALGACAAGVWVEGGFGDSGGGMVGMAGGLGTAAQQIGSRCLDAAPR